MSDHKEKIIGIEVKGILLEDQYIHSVVRIARSNTNKSIAFITVKSTDEKIQEILDTYEIPNELKHRVHHLDMQDVFSFDKKVDIVILHGKTLDWFDKDEIIAIKTLLE